jgi:predicted acetyltransferase
VEPGAFGAEASCSGGRGEHKPHLRNLLSDYLLELSRYDEVDLNYLDAYWEEIESRWPYLIERNDQCVGFTFVDKWSPSGRGTDFSMAEFYIVPDARPHGVGRDAAEAILHAHSGVWELEQLKSDGEMIYRFTIG